MIKIAKKQFLKLNIIVLCMCLLVLTGCSNQNLQKNSDKLSVVTVLFNQYDFAKAVCGDMANVKMLMRPGAEVHGYEPSLADIVAIENADVFIYNGGESDVWIERILSSVDTSNMTVLSLMKHADVTLLPEETIKTNQNHNHSHKHQHKSDSYDEHIWTSPKNAIAMTQAIADAVGAADEENSKIYRHNAEIYIEKLREIDLQLRNTIENSNTKLITVADRFPFLYMAKEYDMQYMAAFSACSPESDAGPSVIAHMTDEIKLHGIDTVFYIELSNQKMADAICEHTGAKKALLHSCQSVSKADFESGKTYVDLMNENIDNLKEALS